MKLICKLPIDAPLGKEVQNGKIFEFPKNKKNEWYIPEEIKEIDGKKFMVEVKETGGGLTNTGYAQLVCGMHGERLKPFVVLRRGHLACGEHAIFALQKCFIVNASKKDNMITITKIEVEEDGDKVKIKQEIVFEGEPEESQRTKIFVPVMKAAVKKCNDYHCRKAYYIE